ncbi:MAG: type II toxin-antitoxin system VapC family toxin [Devosia sp.]|nr:type II toxin-antitoxin system VapC family toxin [Devosia sp.]
MRFLLDTNVISELRKSDKGNQQVWRWASGIDDQESAISAITLMELQYGALLGRTKNSALSGELIRWISESVRPRYEGRILAVDEAVALRCAQLIHPRTRPLNDSLIAATALVHDLIVVTRNVDDFGPMGVRLLNPWST